MPRSLWVLVVVALALCIFAYRNTSSTMPVVVPPIAAARVAPPVATPTVATTKLTAVAKVVVSPDTGIPRPGRNNALYILDGTASVGSGLTYEWRQVSGPDLRLAPLALAQDRVGMRIYNPGTYVFELNVTANGASSAPDQVQFVVP